jgi:histidine triad (HIT) family protein
MENCIFCKIVKGEIPASKVYEDKEVLAFLDINPISEGHTLVIPKKHYENIYDLPLNELNKITEVIKKIVKKYKDKLNINELNILNSNGKNAQQDVPHFHIHLVPRKQSDGLNLWNDKKNIKYDFQSLLNKIGKIE